MKYRPKIVCFSLLTQSTRPISWSSSPVVGMPKRTEPQGSAVVGRYFVARTTAGALNRVGEIRFAGKNEDPVDGSIRVRAPLDWHAADSIAVKSPASIA